MGGTHNLLLVAPSETHADLPTVTLLGGFGVWVGGEQVTLPLNAQRVLALLAVHDRTMTRTQLAGTLWADSTEERAAASLRSELWRLGTTGHDLVDAHRDVVSLAPGVEVDMRASVERAHRLLGWHLGDPTDGTPDPSQEHLDWLALCSGLLPGWFDDWVIIERERFDQLRLHALEALCLRLIAEERFGPAVEAGHAAVAAEPLRESAHRGLVQAHLAQGNWADALHQYDLYRRLCRKEFGCEPSARMSALVEGLRRPGSPWLSTTPAR